jgi:glutathione synthase/RimK-type ligase-like ATP-grasp enzyme
VTDLLLATCASFRDGEPGGHLIVEALATEGVSAAWAVWDDPAVDWGGARMVAVRSTWDYEWRREEFLAWARRVESSTLLVSSADVLEWNTDKSYLLGLAATGLPMVPTLAVDDRTEVVPAASTFGSAVLKPRVGAGGRGVVVVDARPGRTVDVEDAMLGEGPWVVQPLVESVRSEGETSVFVLGGRPVSQVRKRPGGDEIRVHESYGGRTDVVALTDEAAALAERAVTTAEEIAGARLPYGRVDMMRMPDGRLVVSEVEVAEPGLYLEELPENAAAFARAVVPLLPTR